MEKEKSSQTNMMRHLGKAIDVTIPTQWGFTVFTVLLSHL